jgi:DNA-binding NtrC family response regulator
MSRFDPADVAPPPEMDLFRAARDEFTRAFFEDALRATKGCITMVAEHAGLHRNTVLYHLKRLGIDADDYRRDPLSHGDRVRRLAAAPGGPQGPDRFRS